MHAPGFERTSVKGKEKVRRVNKNRCKGKNRKRGLRSDGGEMREEGRRREKKRGERREHDVTLPKLSSSQLCLYLHLSRFLLPSTKPVLFPILETKNKKVSNERAREGGERKRGRSGEGSEDVP